jgi:DNA-binding CsgD family transcriptional regulator
MRELTQREAEVLVLIGKAKSNKQIAELLHVSVHTVGNHRKHICRKLGLHTTAELVAYAIRKASRG